MASIQKKIIVSAPLELVWKSWADFPNIDRFHPLLKSSVSIANKETHGVHAERQCNFADGKNWIRERVTSWDDQNHIEIEIFDGTMPLKSANARITTEAINQSQTEVSFTINFEPKGGAVGKLMIPMMKLKFGGMISQLLQANADHVSRENTPKAA